MPTSETPRATQLPDGRWQLDISRYPVVREILRGATERHFQRRMERYDESVRQAAEDARDEGLRPEQGETA